MVYYRIAVYTPQALVEVVRQAMHEAGAGKTQNLSGFSFSMKGMYRSASAEAQIDGERIESICPKNKLSEVLTAICRAYPDAQSMIEVVELSSWPPYTVG